MRQTILFLALTALLLLASVARAQSGGGYDLTWSTVDGGGATWSEGGGYAWAARSASRMRGCSPAGGTPWRAASGAARRPATASTCRWCCGIIEGKVRTIYP
jgi:hypothetical protein